MASLCSGFILLILFSFLCGKIHIKLTILTLLSAQVRGISTFTLLCSRLSPEGLHLSKQKHPLKQLHPSPSAATGPPSFALSLGIGSSSPPVGGACSCVPVWCPRAMLLRVSGFVLLSFLWAVSVSRRSRLESRPCWSWASRWGLRGRCAGRGRAGWGDGPLSVGWPGEATGEEDRETQGRWTEAPVTGQWGRG